MVAAVVTATTSATATDAAAAGADQARSAALPAPVRIPTYDPTADPDALRVLTLEFPVQTGERRVVVADVVAYQPRDTPDRAMMATLSLNCWPQSTEVTSSGATQNLTRGRTTPMQARFLYVAGEAGPVTCTLNAYGSRPRPTYGGSARNRWYADTGTRISVGAPQPAWSASHASSGRSTVVRRGAAARGLATFAQSLGSSHTARLDSDHKVTTCSSVGGSRDETTDGRDLCASHVSARGSRVRLVVRAVQLGRHGPCGRQTVVDRVYRVTPAVHHLMIHATGTLRASRVAGCLRDFRVSTVLRGVGGAPFVVHRPSELTTVARG